MSVLDQGRETQLRNIESKTGRTLVELRALIAETGLTRHSEIRGWLMERLGLGYGDANSLVHFALESDGQRAAEARGASPDDVLGEIYAGSKAPLRPIHDQLMAEIGQLGPFEIVPKKGYISLRRKKQFAMIGPGTKSRVEVGLNMKGIAPTARLAQLAPGGMCQYKVMLASPTEVDAELMNWIRLAYDAAA